jgi:hypothetical protein
MHRLNFTSMHHRNFTPTHSYHHEPLPPPPTPRRNRPRSIESHLRTLPNTQSHGSGVVRDNHGDFRRSIESNFMGSGVARDNHTVFHITLTQVFNPSPQEARNKPENLEQARVAREALLASRSKAVCKLAKEVEQLDSETFKHDRHNLTSFKEQQNALLERIDAENDSMETDMVSGEYISLMDDLNVQYREAESKLT